ncbi:uncharacterized protein BDR25DRAFT_303747 [Lindgomyces ingoldianus]|uniref:Uncharacterized protein n=1 Tax=Lindgomyces ingoldianus TaxID=673940 RepID=A0ACB6QUS6_9PLEO|nr:uncharacterized protein BDR25DRAFT_303747 [Lindgomyces ingoldianus]KAF2470748.1 hypothetical protein BDR25DRAFT_303747 [Lindgomyces ingoldianus]
MGSAFKHNSHLGSSSSPLPVTRPYTPPEMGSPSSNPFSDYSTDPTTPLMLDSKADIIAGSAHDHLCYSSPTPTTSPYRRTQTQRPSHLENIGKPRADTPLEAYTPTKTSVLLPEYPYTPKTPSTKIPAQLQTFSPMPWAENSSPPEQSPVQSALVSCLQNLSNLIHDTRPDDKEMEYLIGQFEAISGYLARNSNRDPPALGPGSGTAGLENIYMKEVETYIDGVRAYTRNLRVRLEEVRELNRIQWEVIQELRGAKVQDANSSTPETAQEPPPVVPPIVKEEKKGIWGALGAALDAFGAQFFEW